MKVVNEFESYGYKIWEIDDGTFHLIQDDGSPLVCEHEQTAVIMSQMMWARNEIKRLKRANRLWIVTTCFFATCVGILAVRMVM